ncbi:peptide chain release factor N(5)-glutamine methyltransferase [Desulfoplanes formicivorans]|uniref:Release factor glutamine methyltransferase n=1 Tax=Desulfoplanes formicivorans TaxID=1592317 RepID=A0A194AGQ4_9BACT|nr:peptide chain release factor N(5)-glutamine methyltransferase [Desulfoplanes formicivorans]GAU08390.1 protein-(glutamine-N5) methyltransferase [Desulfoplanes formicivorans]
MPHVLEILRQAEALLAHHAVDSPRLSAQILLAKVLGLSRLDLMLEPLQEVSSLQRKVFDRLVTRRSRGEPVAYLVGHKEFYGLDFMVDHRVLIPRPETEELVEHLHTTLDPDAAFVFADVGTGSGALAVTLAHLFPRARGVAVDIDAGALDVARHNARKHGVLERLMMVRGDLATSLLPLSLDLVVTNPPYVSDAEYADLSREVAEFEPQKALVAGPDGMDCLRRIEAQARTVLKPQGSLWAEMGWKQGGLVSRLFGNWAECTVYKDLGGRDRFVHAIL